MNGEQKMRKIRRWLLPLACLLLTFLTGCVRYEVGVSFEDQHHGAIVQHIKLGQQLTSLSQSEANKWLDSIEERAVNLQGKAKRISSQEITVTIPFNNGQDLTDKFNQFFKPKPQKRSRLTKSDSFDLVQLTSEMSIHQSNLLLVERDRLQLEVDLRPLGVLSNQGNIIVSPGSLIELDFILNTPWGARTIVGNNLLTPEVGKGRNQLVWHLQPGQVNKIETVFWIPSFLGLGTVVIILLIVGGFYLKYKRLPLVNSRTA